MDDSITYDLKTILIGITISIVILTIIRLLCSDK